MLFYLLTTKELRGKVQCGTNNFSEFLKLLIDIFTGLGYPFDESMIQANINYYLPRTTHGSTLSKMIFSNVCTVHFVFKLYTKRCTDFAAL